MAALKIALRTMLPINSNLKALTFFAMNWLKVPIARSGKAKSINATETCKWIWCIKKNIVWTLCCSQLYSRAVKAGEKLVMTLFLLVRTVIFFHLTQAGCSHTCVQTCHYWFKMVISTRGSFLFALLIITFISLWTVNNHFSGISALPQGSPYYFSFDNELHTHNCSIKVTVWNQGMNAAHSGQFCLFPAHWEKLKSACKCWN